MGFLGLYMTNAPRRDISVPRNEAPLPYSPHNKHTTFLIQDLGVCMSNFIINSMLTSR